MWWIVSAAAALVGANATHWRVRKLRAMGAPVRPRAYWSAGVATLAPAWLIALLGLAWIEGL